MTQEHKELLLKDLCARLPYGVKLSYRCNHIHTLKAVHKSGLIVIDDTITNITTTTDVENIKPYLFPMSSMTEEQKKECNFADDLDSDILDVALCTNHYNRTGIPTVTYNLVDWCNKNHFDYRGLIEKGLAIDATNKDIY